MRTTRLLTTALTAVGLALAPAATAVAEPPDRTVPTLSITDVKWQTFFPAPDHYKDSTLLSYAVSDEVDTALDVHLRVTDDAGGLVHERVTQVASPASARVGWNGRSDGGALQPEGDYTVALWATDAAGNASPEVSRVVTVDRARLVSRTFRRDVGARASVVERDVRRCATMPSPVRGWKGSLGYYSNRRCNATGTPSVAATVNGMRVPQAFRHRGRAYYGTVRVSTWGGNARHRAGSKSVLQYWNREDRTWFAARTMGSRLTSHAGPRKRATPMVYANDGKPYIIWSLLTANGHWYDVKKFSVVLRYQVLKQPAARAAVERVPARPVAPRVVPDLP